MSFSSWKCGQRQGSSGFGKATWARRAAARYEKRINFVARALGKETRLYFFFSKFFFKVFYFSTSFREFLFKNGGLSFKNVYLALKFSFKKLDHIGSLLFLSSILPGRMGRYFSIEQSVGRWISQNPQWRTEHVERMRVLAANAANHPPKKWRD